MSKSLIYFICFFTSLFAYRLPYQYFNRNSQCCRKQSIISVGGTGTIDVAPDFATIIITISEKGATSQLAQSNTNARINAVLNALSNRKIPPKDIQTSSLNLYPEYNYTDNGAIIIGQQASQTITIIVRKLAPNGVRLGKIIDSLTPINGIFLSGINYGLNNPQLFSQQLKTAAWNDALLKAQKYAKLSGLTLGKPIKITDSPIVTINPLPNVKRFAPATIINEGQIKLTSTVAIEFNSY